MLAGCSPWNPINKHPLSSPRHEIHHGSQYSVGLLHMAVGQPQEAVAVLPMLPGCFPKSKLGKNHETSTSKSWISRRCHRFSYSYTMLYRITNVLPMFITWFNHKICFQLLHTDRSERSCRESKGRRSTSRPRQMRFMKDTKLLATLK
jgi:hypothetical protein